MGQNIYKTRYKELCQKLIKRDGITKLLETLECTDFYDAPASTQYHHSHKHGLVEHSLQVFDNLVEKQNFYDLETIAIVSLLHDLCKIGYYVEDTRNVKENGVWKQVPYYKVDDKFPYGHGEKSVYLINQFMKLTDHEAQAIRFHMGAYEGQHMWNTLGKVYTENPLTFHLFVADMESTYDVYSTLLDSKERK